MKKLAALITCIGWTTLTLQAQDPIPRPPARVAAPPMVLAPAAPIELPSPDAQTVALHFSNAPVMDVLFYYEALVGKPIICDSTVAGAVTVTAKGPVSREHAARLIEESLFLNGFTLIHSTDDKTIKVIGLGKPGRAYGVPVYKSADLLPQSEQLVSLIVHLKHVDSQEMAARLMSYSPPSTNIGFTASGGDTIILTGQTSFVREVLKILEAFDTPGAVTKVTEVEK